MPTAIILASTRSDFERADRAFSCERDRWRAEEHVLSFGQPTVFDSAGAHWRITLLPAGHVFGSAMSWIEAQGHSLLYTGDFKLRRGLSAEPCEPRRAETLIMESLTANPVSVSANDRSVEGCHPVLSRSHRQRPTAVLLVYRWAKARNCCAGWPMQICQLAARIGLQTHADLRAARPDISHYARFEGQPVAAACSLPAAAEFDCVLRKLGRRARPCSPAGRWTRIAAFATGPTPHFL